MKFFTMALSLAWWWLFKSKHVAFTYAFIIWLCWLKYILIKWIYNLLRISRQSPGWSVKSPRQIFLQFVSSSVKTQPFIAILVRQLKKRMWRTYDAIIHDKFSNKTIQRTVKEKLTLMGKENRKFVTKQKQITNEENEREE